MQAPDGAAAPAAQRSPEVAAEQSAAELRLQRNLKFVVAGLALLLVAGLLAVGGRVIYLASTKQAQPAAPTLAIRPEQSVALPTGAQVRSVSLSGDRLAVHFEAGGRAGIAILDLNTGRTITNVDIE
jgi:Family of unknown function (DUF6476)